MLCENAYYPDNDEKKKLFCKSKQKAKEDTFTGERCPLIYYCTVNSRFENTVDMFSCRYRENKNDR